MPIEAGANVNAKDNSGHTPLMLAVEEQHIDIVNILLYARANEKQGQTFEELFIWVTNYQNSAGFEQFQKISFKDQLTRMIRNEKLSKRKERYYSTNASIPSADTLPPEGGVSAGDVGFLK